jgi:hypothetical protein
VGLLARAAPLAIRRKFKAGDLVQIIQIPEHLKDLRFDLRDAVTRRMRTGELFRFCLGREFTVRGFGRYGHVELDVSDDSGVRKKFGKYDTIWIEREFLERVEGSA